MRSGRQLLSVLLVFVLVLGTGGNAFAFAPAAGDGAKVPASAAKAAPATSAKAPSARAASAFAKFEAALAGAQGVEWSKDSDSPRSVWGFKSGAMVGSAARVATRFLAANKSLFGTDGSDLKTDKVVSRIGIRHIRLQQMANGLPVEGAHVAVHMTSAGRVIGVDSTYKTGLKIDETVNIDTRRATVAVKSKLGSKAKPSSVLAVVWPAGKGKADLAYKVKTQTKNPPGDWTHIIDAGTGKVVSSYNDIRFAKDRAATKSLSPMLYSDTVQEAPPADSGSLGAVSPRWTAGWSTITSQRFDSGSWPAVGWGLYTNQYGRFWGRSSTRRYTYNYSIWPAALGSRHLHPATQDYPHNLESWAIYGPFNLGNATGADAAFKLWLNTEPTYPGYDLIYRLASIDKKNWYGPGTYGSTGDTWIDRTLDMGTAHSLWDLEDLRGEPRVWFAFLFDSDSSVVPSTRPNGAFIDNLLIRKYVQTGSTGTTGGTYTGDIYPFVGSDTKTTQPMTNQHVIVGDTYTYTNASGVYSASRTGVVTAWLKGRYASARNEDVEEAESSNATNNWSFTDSHDDEVNLFYHVNKIHDYYKNTLGFSGMDYPMRAWAHVGSSYDNAYYNPGTGFVYFGDGSGPPWGLNDTAKAADVIYHEYTHATADHILDLPYQLETGAMSEGLADYFAASVTNDSVMGNWVFNDPSDQRDLEQDGAGHTPGHNMRYDDQGVRNSGSDPAPANDWWSVTVPPSSSNDYGWVHHNGQIVGGALWDVRNALTAAKADKIIFESLFFWPYNLESSIRTMRMADDALYGDNNWTNGSPNQAAIDAAMIGTVSPATGHGYPTTMAGSLASSTSLAVGGSAYLGRTRSFAGYVAPSVMGANSSGQGAVGPKMKITLQRYYSGRYRTVGYLMPKLAYYSSAKSRYAASYRPGRRGAWRAIARFPGGLAYLVHDGSYNYYSLRPSSRTTYFVVR